MKKTILGLTLVLSICALVLSGFTAYRVDKMSLPDGDQSAYVDSLVLSSVQNTVNPLFSSVEEVLTFRDLSVEGESVDNEFNLMPEELLKTVAGTLIKREGHASKRSIVYEYRANREVYDNLPQPQSQPDVDATTSAASTSAGGMPYKQDSVPTEVTYTQHDTTINGKVYKVRTKTEKKYE